VAESQPVGLRARRGGVWDTKFPGPEMQWGFNSLTWGTPK